MSGVLQIIGGSAAVLAAYCSCSVFLRANAVGQGSGIRHLQGVYTTCTAIPMARCGKMLAAVAGCGGWLSKSDVSRRGRMAEKRGGCAKALTGPVARKC